MSQDQQTYQVAMTGTKRGFGVQLLMLALVGWQAMKSGKPDAGGVGVVLFGWVGDLGVFVGGVSAAQA